jgi:hypothetical protein
MRCSATAEDVQSRSPTPCGTFAIVKDGRLVSYYYLTKAELSTRLGQQPG